jgi:diguanylate cyclase (GGDEF)-like protein/putative nucleotidyltransferase with HDIG domain
LSKHSDLRQRASGGTDRQDLVRQWILLLPLATAVVGSAMMRLAQEYEEYLPPMFFIGALLVTAAMVHQRRMLNLNQELTLRVQAAHERLDILHRLELEFNQSLNIAQVAQTVLEHTIQSMQADAGALWLSPAFGLTGELDAQTDSHNWHLVASRGWHDPMRHATLEAWNQIFQHETPNSGTHHAQVPHSAPDTTALADLLDVNASVVATSIRWKDETLGTLVIARWQGIFVQGDVVLLDDIALIAGPSLENALLYQTVAARADIDGLTELYNHRAIQERLTQEVSRAQRALQNNPATTFSIAVMDLTDFKIFNDTYGHATGDEVLRTVGKVLRQTFRSSDIIARYGGDEFVVLLPETGAFGADVICARTIEALGAQPIQAPDGSRITIRLAAGVAVFPDDGQTVTDLFQVADERMYIVKSRGRQMLENHQEPESAAGSARSLWESFGALDALITAIDNKDHYTRRQSEQVTAYALLIARELGVSPDWMEAVQTCGLLHDIGKIAVPDAILRKPGRLNSDEMRLMQQHTEFGPMLVRDVPHAGRVIEGIRHHHEAYDGNGYPDGLSGEAIPFLSRLLAVPDCYCAMTMDRPYRKALSPELAIQELELGRGTQFDPEILDAFLHVLDAIANGDMSVQSALQPMDAQCAVA